MPSPTVQYQYANGSSNSTRLTSVTYPNGRALNYGYGSSGDVNDAASRVTSIADGSSTRASYEYLGMGTVARVDYPEPSIENVLAGGGTNPNTGDIYTGLDQFGRIIDCWWRKHSSPTADIERVNYTYDRVGNRLTRQNVVAATTSNNFWDEKYTYDALYRLTDTKRGTLTSGGSINPLKFRQNWTLDATGNWDQFKQDDTGDGTWDLQQTRTASKVNAITDISETAGPSWATPAYDANGNMTTIPKTDAPTTTYTAKYDAWNRLVKLTDTGTGNTVQENAYDGRGYRTIRKTYTSGTLTETRHFYYTESWQCVEERLGTSPSTASPNRHFVWGIRYIDDLILRDRSVSGTLDERLYAQQDCTWNITVVTAASATIQNRFTFSPYGLHISLNASFAPATSTVEWDHLFGSYRYDQSVLLYPQRQRAYCASLGTWNRRDPIGYAGTTNLIAYAYNMPLRFIDPYGLDCNDVLTAPRTEVTKPIASFTPDEFRRSFIHQHALKQKEYNSLFFESQLQRGCLGVSCMMAGIPGARDPNTAPYHAYGGINPRVDYCYKTLDGAKRTANHWTKTKKCCGKNETTTNAFGTLSTPRIIMLQFNDIPRSPYPTEEQRKEMPRGIYHPESQVEFERSASAGVDFQDSAERFNLEDQPGIKNNERLPNRTFWDLFGGYSGRANGNFDAAIMTPEGWLNSSGAGGAIALVSHDYLRSQFFRLRGDMYYDFNCAFYCVICDQ